MSDGLMEQDDLVGRLRHLVSLNEPRYGGPYRGVAAEACIKAMAEAADRIASQAATIEELRAENENLHAWFEGLTPAEMHASIVRILARAEAAEAEVARLKEQVAEMREALRPFSDASVILDEFRVPDDQAAGEWIVQNHQRSLVPRASAFRRARRLLKDSR